MTRLTRAQTQARTRSQLIATATELFLRDGYAATSLDKIAETAGFTRGAVYSNFRNKDELCLAVLDEYRATKVAEIMASLSVPTLDARIGGFEQWAERVIGDPQWTRLELEFAAHASRDEALAAQVGERLRQLLDLIGAALQAATAQADVELPLPADEAAVAVLSLGVGLGLFRSIEPALPIGALTNTLRVLAQLKP